MHVNTRSVHLYEGTRSILCQGGQPVRTLGRLLVLALSLQGAVWATTVINFEQFNDSEILTTQIPGLTFTNTTILTAGISLDEFEFPPHSGSNVASDNGGPITITFSSLVSFFDGYFTYAEPLTLDGFGSANNLLASVNSQFSSNLALSGDPGSSPNEFLQISSPAGFTQVTITGDPNGGSFVMDDISFGSVPEPGSYALLLLGTAALVAFRVRKKA